MALATYTRLCVEDALSDTRLTTTKDLKNCWRCWVYLGIESIYFQALRGFDLRFDSAALKIAYGVRRGGGNPDLYGIRDLANFFSKMQTFKIGKKLV